MIVFKIVDANEWKAAQDAGAYRGSAADQKDGFIHLSTSAQLAETLSRHFAQADNLMLVAIDGGAVSAALKWEKSSSGGKYPHLYGDLELAAVQWSSAIPRKPGGVFVLPVRAFADNGEGSVKIN
ncbi:MAG TPA: DUF952 domain-containing protein [Rhizomicrobium sp.]